MTRYLGDEVARTLAADFEQHGAPLVLRLDRARMHQTAEVLAVLEAHKVLLLHGPPHFPQFYGQHERQNREHRAWLRALPATLTTHQLAGVMSQMQAALNGKWRRATLDWCTAEELWRARPPLDVDRDKFREEVIARAATLKEALSKQPRLRSINDLAWRLAIQQVLMSWKLITLEKGGWC